jgi:hypothetical protein
MDIGFLTVISASQNVFRSAQKGGRWDAQSD